MTTWFIDGETGVKTDVSDRCFLFPSLSKTLMEEAARNPPNPWEVYLQEIKNQRQSRK